VRTTEVVNDDTSAPRGEEEGVCLPQTTAGAGDDNDLIIKTQFGHFVCVESDQFKVGEKKGRNDGESDV
jgi:hypothetical protein